MFYALLVENTNIDSERHGEEKVLNREV